MARYTTGAEEPMIVIGQKLVHFLCQQLWL